MPAVDSDILYSRLFGHGEHNLYQFDDVELLQIEQQVNEMGRGEAYLTFHRARMYSDAARLKVSVNGRKLFFSTPNPTTPQPATTPPKNLNRKVYSISKVSVSWWE